MEATEDNNNNRAEAASHSSLISVTADQAPMKPYCLAGPGPHATAQTDSGDSGPTRDR